MISDAKTVHILLVEDNPADVYLLRRALSKAGVNFELKIFDDGAEALEFTRHQTKLSPKDHGNFDLVVLDLNLPSNGGIEVLAAIRQNEILADTPVVVLTSSAASLERSQVEQLNISRFITKPPDLVDFLQIGNVLKELLSEKVKE